jgi:rhodanese-related sulfurtransferase
MAKEVYKGELDSLVKDGAVLVDVREADEVAEAQGLPGTTHLPLSRLSELAAQITRDRPLIFYCRSGVRSFQAAEIAASWTEQPVYYLSGGLLGSDA